MSKTNEELQEEEKDKSNKEPRNVSSDSETIDLESDDSDYVKEDNKKLQEIISKMSESELQRYETFRRSNFPKGVIKKFISNVIGQAVNPNLVIAVSGLAKVYVGEMIEVAKEVQRERGEDGPLLPSHIHEAHRRVYKRMPNTSVFQSPPWN